MKINRLLLICPSFTSFWLASCCKNEAKAPEVLSIDKVQKRLDFLEKRVESLIEERAADDAAKRAESNGFRVKRIK